MYFDSFSEFVHMGGHGLYVWMAYGATILALLINAVSVRMAHNRHVRQLRWQFQLDDTQLHNTPANESADQLSKEPLDRGQQDSGKQEEVKIPKIKVGDEP